MSEQLFSIGAVAAELGVTTQAVWNWRRRYPQEVPPSDAEVFDRSVTKSQPAWSGASMDAWREWYRIHSGTDTFKKYNLKGRAAQ